MLSACEHKGVRLKNSGSFPQMTVDLRGLDGDDGRTLETSLNWRYRNQSEPVWMSGST